MVHKLVLNSRSNGFVAYPTHSSLRSIVISRRIEGTALQKTIATKRRLVIMPKGRGVYLLCTRCSFNGHK